MLMVYGDESFDETQDRVCAVVGIVGSDAEWDRFEPLWVERNGRIPFHAKECDSDHGDYLSRSHLENKALYRDLTILLADSSLRGYAAVSDISAEKKYFPATTMVYLREFSSVVEQMFFLAREIGDLAEMCFDSRTESDYNAALMYGNARSKDPSWHPFLSSKVSFESSISNPRIQVADLFAREAMKILDNEIGPVKREPRKSWLALEKTRRFSVAMYRDAFFADEYAYCAANEAKGREKYDQYSRWLTEKRRQPNESNMIWFIGAPKTPK